MKRNTFRTVISLLSIVLASVILTSSRSSKNDNDRGGDPEIFCRCVGNRCLASLENDPAPLCWWGVNVNCRTNDASCEHESNPTE